MNVYKSTYLLAQAVRTQNDQEQITVNFGIVDLRYGCACEGF